MKKPRQKKRSYSKFSPFVPSETEMFLQGFKGFVTKPIVLYEAGQVEIQGVPWRAELYDLNCQTTLLKGQRVLAIGQENATTLIVMPYHCLLWELIDESWPFLTNSDIETMRKHERCWMQP